MITEFMDIIAILTGLLFVFLGGGVWFFARRKKHARLLKAKQEKEIFQLARKKQGRLSISDVVTETSVPAQDAASALESLVSQGYAGGTVTDSGLMLYEFSEVALEPSAFTEAEKHPAIIAPASEKTRDGEQQCLRVPVKEHGSTQKIWLLEGVRLFDSPNGHEVGEIYPAGSEFEYCEHEQKSGWYCLRDTNGAMRWISPKYVSSEDPRHFFKMSNQYLTGYLARRAWDGSGGNLQHLGLIDTFLGAVEISIEKIVSIAISAEDQESAQMTIETIGGQTYTGKVRPYWVSDYFLVSEESTIRLADIRQTTLIPLRTQG